MPGVETTVTIQYVIRFRTANAASTLISTGDMALICAHTSEKSATLLLTYQATARTRTTDIPICRMRRDRLRGAGEGRSITVMSSTGASAVGATSGPASGLRPKTTLPRAVGRDRRHRVSEFVPVRGWWQGRRSLAVPTLPLCSWACDSRRRPCNRADGFPGGHKWQIEHGG